jgi:glycerophosphoryl diester phosphodiesterase
MIDWPRPLIFAHRGDSVHAPENTLASFELAARQGADAVELDAKLTSDGHVVVIHDATVDRTSNGNGKVARMPLAALRELDAGVRFSEQFRGEKIPTLDEVFEAVGKKVFINVELTNYSTPLDSLVPKVVLLVRKHGLEGRVLFSSFFPQNLFKAAQLQQGVPRGLLTWAGWMGWWGRTYGFRSDMYQALHPHLSDVIPGLVDRIHAAGKRIHVWTVDAEADMKRLIGYGVDGLFTDDPALAARLLGRMQ